MRTMHLFAGVGGGLLADRILGHTSLVAVEWEPYACQVLRERAADGWFPGLQVWEGDIRLFDPSEYTGIVDCIHAGFPCQDISVAGKQAGVSEGTRSGLYREVLRVAGIIRPRFLFLENVAAIKSNGLDTVLKDLALMGYDTRWLCIRASDVGANHHRDRWFLLAHTNNGRIQGGGTGANVSQDVHLRKGIPSDGAQDIRGQKAEILDHTHSAQRQGNERTERVTQEHADINGSSWWTTESNVDRVANGVSNRVHRLKGLGNAQVPLQAATAFTILVEGLVDENTL
jgi:DNA (cytosine-5)-methyltransferase 1